MPNDMRSCFYEVAMPNVITPMLFSGRDANSDKTRFVVVAEIAMPNVVKPLFVFVWLLCHTF